MIENRIATWVSIAVGALVATPIARSLYNEYREHREKNVRTDAQVIPLPGEWTRDIYDSTR